MQKQRVMSAMAATIVRNFHTMSPKPKSQSGTQQHNGNGRNDYAEFSHGEHPKSQLEKSA